MTAAAKGRVKFNREWDEYVVTFADGGTYHTDDREDAYDTLAQVEGVPDVPRTTVEDFGDIEGPEDFDDIPDDIEAWADAELHRLTLDGTAARVEREDNETAHYACVA